MARQTNSRRNTERRIDYLPIERLKPARRNPKRHAGTAIASSIGLFGYIDPIIIDERTGRIVSGHGRLDALRTMRQKGAEPPAGITVDGSGAWSAPVLRGWASETDIEAESYLLASNRLVEAGGWDRDELHEVLVEIHADGVDTACLGWSESELELAIGQSLVTDDDDIPEPPSKPVTRAGDLWQLGRHRVLCGDAILESSVLKLIGEETVDIIFTDPPYGINLDTDFSSMNGTGRIYEPIIGDDHSYDPAHIFRDFPTVKEVFLWGADYYAERIPERNNGSLFVWDKAVGDCDKVFGSNFELCWSKQKHKRELIRILWKGKFGLSSEDTKHRIHPTQKPTKLAAWFLGRFSSPGARVIDLFLGSGSTLIAAEQLDRICYGVEISPAYCDTIVDRWETATGGKARKSKT